MGTFRRYCCAASSPLPCSSLELSCWLLRVVPGCSALWNSLPGFRVYMHEIRHRFLTAARCGGAILLGPRRERLRRADVTNRGEARLVRPQCAASLFRKSVQQAFGALWARAFHPSWRAPLRVWRHRRTRGWGQCTYNTRGTRLKRTGAAWRIFVQIAMYGGNSGGAPVPVPSRMVIQRFGVPVCDAALRRISAGYSVTEKRKKVILNGIKRTTLQNGQWKKGQLALTCPATSSCCKES